MAGQRSVVKHSYLTGKGQGKARAQAHIRYIQFRAGKDKEEETRSFFNAVREDIYSSELKQAISEQNERTTVMHKLILSPGVPDADVKEYCREVMTDLASRKGLDLEWYAVRHDNTDNPHCHIVVMGTDANGHKVRIYKDDYTKIKEAGDRYLERNRLLDREEKEKDKDKEDRPRDDRNPVSRFVDALKTAAREFTRAMERDDRGETKENKFEQRRREKDEERQREAAALGAPVDFDEYLVKLDLKEERDKERREKAWKEYCKPIDVSDSPDKEPTKYDRASSLADLRQLERAGDSLKKPDRDRLESWIKEKYREEKRVEQKAEKLQNIDVELDTETKGNWSKASALDELRKLEALNTRGEVYLDDAEKKALGAWIKDAELKQPIRVQVEPESEPAVYDRDDSKESLQFLARQYANGAHWARENMSESDYRKVRTWIAEKDKPKEAERQSNDKDPDKKEKVPRRKQSVREKRMERSVRLDRAERWANYYKEKSEQRDRLEGQKENLKAQKRALNKYEKERETVDGQYSEIWGADKSALATGSMGAISGGARPLGANQFVKLITQAKKSWGEKQKLERAEAATTQSRLADKLTQDKKTEKPADKQPATRGVKPKEAKPAEKTTMREPAKDKEPVPIDNSKLETETKELGKDVKKKKKAEKDRDQRPGPKPEERKDWDRFDPWGRY